MKRIYISFFGLLFTIMMNSCQDKVDLIVYNATVYTMNENLGNTTAFVVNDGRFIAVGGEELLEKYSGRKLDLQGLPVYPGFIDSHCHFMSLGLSLQQVDLRGTQSFEEVISKVKDFAKNKDLIFSVLNLVIFTFFMASLVFVFQFKINHQINSFLDALYFTLATLTTT